MRDVLVGCARVGIGLRLPPEQPVPDHLIKWHDPSSAFPGETVQAAHDAAEAWFQAKPDIIFVVLPDRGAVPFQQLPAFSTRSVATWLPVTLLKPVPES